MSAALSYNIASKTGQNVSTKNFKVKIHIKCVDEVVVIDDLSESTQVWELKHKIESVAGIPG